MSSASPIRFRCPPSQWARLFVLSVAVGVLAGGAAAAMEWALHHLIPHLVGRFTHLGGPRLFDFQIGILLLPVLGGIASAVFVQLLCPPHDVSGAEAVVRAFHHGGGDLPLRIPALRTIANVAVIASGGSTGPEGPIAALGAAMGSTLAGANRMTARERRLFLLAGCAAGVSAMFQCPLGGALFATTINYREPENEDEALMPAIVASVMGYATCMALIGYEHPLLSGAGKLAFTQPIELLAYVLLALICTGVGIVFHHSLRFVASHPFGLRLPRWLRPIVGGLGLGAIACAVPQVMDARYAFVQSTLDGTFLKLHSWVGWAGLFALIIVAKCYATAFTIGTGNAGGTLGPTVFMGGMAGALTGVLLEGLFPGMFPEGLRQALIPVGMAGLLAMTQRVPLAAAVMVLEITGSYGLIVPLIFVTVLAYVLGRRWGLNHEQLGSPADSPAHAGRPILNLLETLQVADIMALECRVPAAGPAAKAERGAPAFHPADTILDALALLQRHGLDAAPVVEHGECAGTLTREAIYKVVRDRYVEERTQFLAEHGEVVGALEFK
jgi:CIC family chloride channel protein